MPVQNKIWFAVLKTDLALALEKGGWGESRRWRHILMWNFDVIFDVKIAKIREETVFYCYSSYETFAQFDVSFWDFYLLTHTHL